MAPPPFLPFIGVELGVEKKGILRRCHHGPRLGSRSPGAAADELGPARLGTGAQRVLVGDPVFAVLEAADVESDRIDPRLTEIIDSAIDRLAAADVTFDPALSTAGA